MRDQDYLDDEFNDEVGELEEDLSDDLDLNEPFGRSITDYHDRHNRTSFSNVIGAND